MIDEIFKHFLQVLIISSLTIYLSGTGSASAFDNPVQPLLHDRKINSSAELPVELPPRVFPKDFDNGALHRPVEELPPLFFPKELDDKNHALSDTKSVDNSSNGKDTKKIMNLVANQMLAGKIGSEVPDLLSSDSYNRTVYEDGTEGPIQNDTVMVTGPHVINSGKTHEEDVTTSSVGKKDSVMSALSLLNGTETTVYNNHNVTIIHDEPSAITDIERNVTSTEGFVQSGNVTEEENGTSLDDAFKANASVPVTETNIAGENPKNVSISDKSKDRKVKTEADNRTIKVETTTKPESNRTIKDETTTKPGPSTTKEFDATESTSKSTVQQSTITTLQPTLKAESTTSVNISENIIDHKAEDMPVALAASQEHADHSHASTGKSSAFLQPTESAAILAGVFVGIALIGYVGLLVWRRVLEKRYGNREMLVNEDDFYDTNDLRNYEL